MSTNFKSLGAKRCISPGQAARLMDKITALVAAEKQAHWQTDPQLIENVSTARNDLDKYITKLRGGTTA